MKTFNFLWSIWKLFFENLAIVKSLKRFQIILPEDAREVWVVESVADFSGFCAIYYYLKCSIQLGRRPKVIFVNPLIRFHNNIARKRTKIIRFLTQNKLLLLPWRLMYQTIFPGEWNSFYSLRVNLEQKSKALEIFNTFKNKKDLEELRIDGIWVGDLIYDTYLRFKPAATVDLEDIFLIELLEYTIALIDFIKNMILTNKVNHMLTMFTSYIHHGVLTRVALHYSIKVHTIGGSNQLVLAPTLKYPFHNRNFHLYREWFLALPNQQKCLDRGREIIDQRLSGKIDGLTSYMKESAFSKKIDPEITKIIGELKSDSRKKIIFMGHDFFDSPHFYGDMLFPDFYEWICGCLKFAKSSPYQFIVKSHPNGTPENEKVYDELKNLFPEVIFLPKHTSNHVLSELNHQYFVTVYGTVASEFAAMGRAVICCGENPHSLYSFSYEAKSIEDLEEILLGKKSPTLKVDMNEIYEFLYLHNYRWDQGDLQHFPFFQEYTSTELLKKIEDSTLRTEAMIRGILNAEGL